MSWYSANYKRRAALSVDNTTGGATSINVTCTIPTDWDDFWQHIRSTGEDIKVTLNDGVTLATFAKPTFTFSTRSLVIVVDGVAVTADKVNTLWLYWDYSAETSAGTGAATGTSAKNAYVELSQPTPPNIIVCRPVPPSDTRAAAVIAKSAAEVTHIWWDLAAMLEQRPGTYAGQRLREEIAAVGWVVYASTTPQAGMVTANKTTIVGAGSVVKTLIQAGTSGTNYTGRLTVTTSLGRVLEFSCEVRVRTPTEQ